MREREPFVYRPRRVKVERVRFTEAELKRSLGFEAADDYFVKTLQFVHFVGKAIDNHALGASQEREARTNVKDVLDSLAKYLLRKGEAIER